MSLSNPLPPIYNRSITIFLCFLSIGCTCEQWYQGENPYEKPKWAIERRVPLECSGVVGCSSHINKHAQLKEAKHHALMQLALQKSDGITLTACLPKQRDINDNFSNKEWGLSNVKVIAKWSASDWSMTCVWLQAD